ncbi:Cys/Met metabolism PLP-dependent enzyme-domain-containing protein [Lophiotrema nucula]|uniref:Cys/Met metabolism PLP-dependent enzyme-domain-containing protein n=1 Tax=Lophiotrema nucula TaxID=690887 RepID=A0A6A5ZJ47_9PLEO|nr:Cys/Met metabolism PLP-dependent enzyme-domain-containing protein [Lophiotrema nucula]
MPQYSPATLAVHADDRVNVLTDVAPAIHTSTTFRYPRNADHLQPVPVDGEFLDLNTPLVYSRLTSSNINRLEVILAPLIFPGTPAAELNEVANQVITYSSGLSAFHAMLVNIVPKVIAIGDGYHGCHGVIELHKKMHGVKTVDLHADDAAWDAAGLGKGDIVHLETPLNPTGEAYSIEQFAERAHKRGALLTIDATFGPPGLQDPFAWGADIVMHSGTKYVGGHSDMLCGVLATKKGAQGVKRARTMREERIFLGSVLGSLEGWLGVRSLRTLELRVQRQAANTEKLVAWLNDALNGKGEESETIKKTVKSVSHASLQTSEFSWLKKQMPNGFGPVFAFKTHTAAQARNLPSALHLFHHATSLGGVESLIEWRRMSDSGVDETLLRVSVGVENWEDLRDDFLQAFNAVAEGKTVESNGLSVDVQTGGEGAQGVADGAQGYQRSPLPTHHRTTLRRSFVFTPSNIKQVTFGQPQKQGPWIRRSHSSRRLAARICKLQWPNSSASRTGRRRTTYSLTVADEEDLPTLQPDKPPKKSIKERLQCLLSRKKKKKGDDSDEKADTETENDEIGEYDDLTALPPMPKNLPKSPSYVVEREVVKTEARPRKLVKKKSKYMREEGRMQVEEFPKELRKKQSMFVRKEGRVDEEKKDEEGGTKRPRKKKSMFVREEGQMEEEGMLKELKKKKSIYVFGARKAAEENEEENKEGKRGRPLRRKKSLFVSEEENTDEPGMIRTLRSKKSVWF